MRWSPAQRIPGGLRLQEGAAATLSQEVSPGWEGAWGWGAGLVAMGLEDETGARWACIPECVRVPDASVTLFYVLCPSLRGGGGRGGEGSCPWSSSQERHLSCRGTAGVERTRDPSGTPPPTPSAHTPLCGAV